jgi:hypothetical protein
MRVRQTRESFLSLGEPLTRHPLGGTNRRRRREKLLTTTLAALLWVSSRPSLASSGLSIGLLGNLDDLSVSPVLIGDPLGLRDERWRHLFADDTAGAQALRSTLTAELAARLTTGGLKVTDTSRNGILVSIYGGRRVDGGCALNVFIVEVWVSEGEKSALARAILGEAEDAQLADRLRIATLEIVDELVAMRSRYRASLNAKP